jgi:hypothetical protein
MKEGTFLGRQTRSILEDEAFVERRTDSKRAAWESFKWVCANFLCSNKSTDFSDGFQKLLNACKEMGCRMSCKCHFSYSRLYLFPENLGEDSDEQGERFHQDMKSTEHRSRFLGWLYDEILLLDVELPWARHGEPY